MATAAMLTEGRTLHGSFGNRASDSHVFMAPVTTTMTVWPATTVDRENLLAMSRYLHNSSDHNVHLQQHDGTIDQ
jgi:hypothetical protein